MIGHRKRNSFPLRKLRGLGKVTLDEGGRRGDEVLMVLMVLQVMGRLGVARRVAGNRLGGDEQREERGSGVRVCVWATVGSESSGRS